MNEQEMIKILARKASLFTTGGFRPNNSLTESWVARVFLYREEETIPLDEKGALMFPLFQLCLEELPFVPDPLRNIRYITVFVADELPMDITPNGRNWLLREYGYDDVLVRKELTNPVSRYRPFPLQVKLVEQDCPVWDGGGIPEDVADQIIELEKTGGIDYYYDLTQNHYGHKLGGYPSFCQPGISFGPDFEFVFQIATDEKANLNIIDNGTIFLARSRFTANWVFY